jgi:hypothetical protein
MDRSDDVGLNLPADSEDEELVELVWRATRAAGPAADAQGPPVIAFPRLLRRFQKLVAPPGRPAAALGVPASGEDLAAELAPLLATLDRADVEAAAIRRAAAEEAAERRERGTREAAAMIERARSAAEAERARAAAAGRSEVAARAAGEREATAREILRIEAVREERIDELLAAVMACVRRSGL